MLLCGILTKPLLYLFGAGAETYGYAAEYLRIYALGTPFVMLGTGLNNFINAQGFGKTGMLTVLFGAVLNIALDPIFIFVFDMGIRGAAVATVLSQMVSALWVLRFLTGPKTILKIRAKNLVPDWKIVLKMLYLQKNLNQ